MHSQEPTSCPLNGSSETDSPTRPAVIGKLAAASQDEPHPATKKQVAREDSSTPRSTRVPGSASALQPLGASGWDRRGPETTHVWLVVDPGSGQADSTT